MFKHTDYRRRKNPFPIMVFRMCLSLTMLVILGIGVYQAVKYFSGTDPLESLNFPPEVYSISSSPKEAILSLLSTHEVGKIVASVLGSKSSPQQLPTENTSTSMKAAGPTLKFALVADSHNDNDNLAKALDIAKNQGAKFVIGLGDYTEIGTIDQLQQAKKVFESSGLPFYTTAGDHDLWDATNKGLNSSANFSQVFGPPYQSFSDSNIRFVILFNSDNYEGIDALQQQWVNEVFGADLAKKTFVFLHEPLYHPSSDHMMGKVTPTLADQAKLLAKMFKDFGVLAVFTGDIHAFTRYEDPSGLKMTTVGALTRERNTQAPRFAMVDVYQDGSYNIEDLELK